MTVAIFITRQNKNPVWYRKAIKVHPNGGMSGLNINLPGSIKLREQDVNQPSPPLSRPLGVRILLLCAVDYGYFFLLMVKTSVLNAFFLTAKMTPFYLFFWEDANSEHIAQTCWNVHTSIYNLEVLGKEITPEWFWLCIILGNTLRYNSLIHCWKV